MCEYRNVGVREMLLLLTQIHINREFQVGSCYGGSLNGVLENSFIANGRLHHTHTAHTHTHTLTKKETLSDAGMRAKEEAERMWETECIFENSRTDLKYIDSALQFVFVPLGFLPLLLFTLSLAH